MKGETHYLALVVSKKNRKENTDLHVDRTKPEDREALPEEVTAQMSRSVLQQGLVEMGVFRRSYGSSRACLASDNVDMDKLRKVVRDITFELGLPASTAFFPTNPIQVFDFSRRARCIDPVRILRHSPGSSPCVLSPAEFLDEPKSGIAQAVDALVLPVGDALQEPIWTQHLGINRGFHTGRNQAYAALLAREQSPSCGVAESCMLHDATVKMKWSQGPSGFGGSGSGVGLKPFKEWDTDPRSRLQLY